MEAEVFLSDLEMNTYFNEKEAGFIWLLIS
jgi:hypothetical protein